MVIDLRTIIPQFTFEKLGYHSAVIFDNKISKNISNKFVISRIDCINNTLINS